MQFLIDTDTDKPAELYRIGKFLVESFETTLVEPQDAAPAAAQIQTAISSLDADVPAPPAVPAPPPPPLVLVPAAPLTIDDVVSDNDAEVEIDDEGNVTALTTTVALLPAAAPVAPPPPIPAPPGPAVASEIDSAGYPWDGRIHAANRAKKLDGTWKNKRGVDANLVVAVEAQNKPGNVTPAAAPTVAATTPTAPPAPPAPAAPSAAIAPVPPATPSAPATTGIDFRGLMQKIQAATSAGKLTTEQVNGALATVGLKPEDMGQLIGNVLYIASVNAAIDSCLTG